MWSASFSQAVQFMNDQVNRNFADEKKDVQYRANVSCASRRNVQVASLGQPSVLTE